MDVDLGILDPGRGLDQTHDLLLDLARHVDDVAAVYNGDDDIGQDLAVDKLDLDALRHGLETDEFSKDHKGDDPSEIFDIHEYQEGDKINRIHWKLSAKQNTTMVKDYSLPLASSIILIIDMDIDRTQTGHMKLYDTAVEAVSAVSLYLAENKMAHKLIWFDTIRNENMAVAIKNEDESRVALNMLLRSGLHGSDRPAINNYMNTVDRFKCGHLLYFSAKYDDGLTSVMNDADLAFRYTYMLIDPEKVKKEIYDDFADVVDVVSGAAAESIKDICL